MRRLTEVSARPLQGSGSPALAVLFVAIGITWAVIAVTATGLITPLAPVVERGDAFGLYTGVVAIGTGLGSIAGGGFAAQAGSGPTFTLPAGIVVVATVFIWMNT